MKAFDELWETKVLGNYEGICDRCGAPMAIPDKFWCILIATDEDWNYHLLINFVIYCFACNSKVPIIKTNNHPFDVTSELAALKVDHESQ